MVMNAMASLISKRSVWYPMAGILQGDCGLRNADCGLAGLGPKRILGFEPSPSNPQSAFRNCGPRGRLAAMPVQAIAWSPSGAVRIVDQRALPEACIERDLESVEAVADAIRTLQVRGAPLIGIAAAMGLVAGAPGRRAAAPDAVLAPVSPLGGVRPAGRPAAGEL